MKVKTFEPEQNRHEHVPKGSSGHENSVGYSAPNGLIRNTVEETNSVNSIASSTFAEENIQPLVKVSLDGDIALDKDKPTAHPAHY